MSNASRLSAPRLRSRPNHEGRPARTPLVHFITLNRGRLYERNTATGLARSFAAGAARRHRLAARHPTHADRHAAGVRWRPLDSTCDSADVRGDRRVTHRYAPRYELERVLASLWSVTEAGCGWIARCPFHPTGRRTVSIYEGPGQGEAVVKCHSGCEPRALLECAYQREAYMRRERRRRAAERRRA
jgi:hypothetical protein